MADKLYKCFVCGKSYRDEQRARACHNAPIQVYTKNEKAGKPRFLGNG
jgi:hypothetical protein